MESLLISVIIFRLFVLKNKIFLCLVMAEETSSTKIKIPLMVGTLLSTNEGQSWQYTLPDSAPRLITSLTASAAEKKRRRYLYSLEKKEKVNGTENDGISEVRAVVQKRVLKTPEKKLDYARKRNHAIASIMERFGVAGRQSADLPLLKDVLEEYAEEVIQKLSKLKEQHDILIRDGKVDSDDVKNAKSKKRKIGHRVPFEIVKDTSEGITDMESVNPALVDENAERSFNTFMQEVADSNGFSN